MKPGVLRPQRRLALGGLAAGLAGGLLGQWPRLAQAADDSLPAYARVDKLSGTVKATGSSTVAALLKPLIDRFQGLQPEVQFDIGGAGSGTAVAGMLESPDTLGLLSRPMNARERERFRAQYGYAPLELKVAIDAVAIYVFKDNPLPAISLSELRRAFGRDADAASQWGALGLTGDWRDVPLLRFGLEAGRGAHEVMRDVVLQGRDFAPELAVEPVSTSVVQGVATRPGGIGYASVFFRTQRTRILPISHQGQSLEPTAENASAGRYPLARFLFICVNRKPGVALAPATGRFLQFLLSSDGQDAVARQGLYPLGPGLAREAMAQISGSSLPP